MAITTPGLRRAHSIVRPYARSTGPRAATHSSSTWRLFGTARSQRAAAAGISVRATNSAQSRAKLTVIAN